jgi:mannose-6-phosphate isomerase-like protein (cupin superfamily)
MSYIGHVQEIATENTNFRKVLFTGVLSQLVVMNIPLGGEIGEETHDHVEQTLFILSGEGETLLDGVVTPVGAGDAIVVTPGTRHNIRNTGTTPLQIVTVYAPPNHIDGRIHATKADADTDDADEEFGHAIGMRA